MSFHVAYNRKNRKKYRHFIGFDVSACFPKNSRSILLITVWLRVRVLPGAPIKSIFYMDFSVDSDKECPKGQVLPECETGQVLPEFCECGHDTRNLSGRYALSHSFYGHQMPEPGCRRNRRLCGHMGCAPIRWEHAGPCRVAGPRHCSTTDGGLPSSRSAHVEPLFASAPVVVGGPQLGARPRTGSGLAATLA